VIEQPEDFEFRKRGEGSEEKVTQEQREQTALTALYMSPAHIPDSPAEPSHVIAEEDVDKDVKAMTSGPEVDAVFWSGGPISPVSHVASVADLVGQLAVGNMDPAMGGASFNGQGLDLKAVGLDASATLSAVQALPQEQLQQLLQQLSAPALYPPASQPAYNGADQAWPTPGFPTEYGQGFHDDAGWPSSDAGRGRGNGRGRGRGRGRGDDGGGYRHIKRKPCSFFAAGRRALHPKLKLRATTDDTL
jgi:protein phosphatase 1 regulatory subunit 10